MNECINAEVVSDSPEGRSSTLQPALCNFQRNLSTISRREAYASLSQDDVLHLRESASLAVEDRCGRGNCSPEYLSPSKERYVIEMVLEYTSGTAIRIFRTSADASKY